MNREHLGRGSRGRHEIHRNGGNKNRVRQIDRDPALPSLKGEALPFPIQSRQGDLGRVSEQPRESDLGLQLRKERPRLEDGRGSELLEDRPPVPDSGAWSSFPSVSARSVSTLSVTSRWIFSAETTTGTTAKGIFPPFKEVGGGGGGPFPLRPSCWSHFQNPPPPFLLRSADGFRTGEDWLQRCNGNIYLKMELQAVKGAGQRVSKKKEYCPCS